MQIPFALSTAPKMLKALVKNNGLAKTFDAVISVDDVKIFKPDPKVYQLAPKYKIRLRVPFTFVSYNTYPAGQRMPGKSSFVSLRLPCASYQ